MKKLIAVILALTMVFAMAAIAHADGYTAEEEAEAEAYHIDLIYSNVFNPKEWNYKAAEKFAEMVTERTETATSGSAWKSLPCLLTGLEIVLFSLARCSTTMTKNTTMSWHQTS